MILTIAGTVNGAAPAAGPTPTFTLALNTYSFFENGLVGTNGIQLSHAPTQTDSYNSKTNLSGTRGDVLSNGTITLDNNAVVNGNATATAFSLSNNAVITGQQTVATQPVTFIPVAIPLGLTNLGALALDNGASQTLTAGSYQLDSLSVNNNSRLVIDNTTGPVTLYVTGGVLVTNGGMITTLDTHPEKFALYVASTANVQIDNGGTYYGVLYAPQSLVSLNNGGNFFGSFIGNSLNAINGAQVHYDTALRGE